MSQEYTPVDWVDETPNTPGTLINKARLDQMQTAHHYADGFEEVDAVPTADPGVDYHKVVFCTADTTFYRWDGTQWVKDVDDSTLALLEAHEADHANPHVVTKAQVGLGNVDNTSDADKPVSTAMQTALDGKVDKNASITGATKCKITYDAKGLVTAGADLAESDVPALSISKTTGLQSALDAKVDDSQLKTSWSSPVSDANIPSEKLVSNTLATKVDKLTTTGVYAYTHASGTQGELAINGGAVANTLALRDANAYLTAATNATGTKDNVLTTGTRVQNDLDNYSPMVRITNNQTIAGIKTFTTSSYLNRNWRTIINSTSNLTGWVKMFRLKAGGNTMINVEGISTGSQTPHNVHFMFQQFSNGANSPMVTLLTSDVKGMIDPANFAVVPVTVDGVSYIDYYIKFQMYSYAGLHIIVDCKSRNEGAVTLTEGDYITYYNNTAEDPTGLTGVVYGNMGNGYMMAQCISQRAYNSANNDDVVTIGTLKAATDVVHTTGAETIAGVKTYTGRQIISYTNLELYNSALKIQSQGYDLDTPPSYTTRTLMEFSIASDLSEVASRDECVLATAGNSRSMIIHSHDSNGNDQSAVFSLTSFRDGTSCMRGPNRTYNASNMSDVVNIALLDAYTPMVRTTGNQNVNGIKSFEFNILKEFITKDNSSVSSSTWRRLYNLRTSSSGSNRHVVFKLPNTRFASSAELHVMWVGLTGEPSATVRYHGPSIELRVCRSTDDDGHLEIWTNDHVFAYVEFEGIRTSSDPLNIIDKALSPTDTTEPIVGTDYSYVVTPTVIT